jgi:HlyD family secretion protein
MGKRLAMLGAGCVIAFIAAAHFGKPDSAKQVEAEPARPRTLAPAVLASGTLVYEHQVTLGPELLAKVTRVLVKEGDEVRPGQLMMRLDDESVQAELSKLESSRRAALVDIERRHGKVDLERQRFERYSELHRQGMVESIKFDEVRNVKNQAALDLISSRESVRQIESQIQEARQRLRQTEIKSPIGGRVTRIGMQVGETAVPSAGNVPGSTLVEVADTGSVLAEINVDEADIARIRIGQRAKVVPPGSEQAVLEARVEQIAMSSRTIAGQGKVFSVKLRLAAGSTDAYRSGMTCRAEILLGDGAKPVLSVPLQAIRYDEAAKDPGAQRAALFVVRDGRAQLRKVELGVSDDAFVQVTSGVSPGEDIVTGPHATLRFLRDGDHVVLARADARQAAVSSVPARQAK